MQKLPSHSTKQHLTARALLKSYPMGRPQAGFWGLVLPMQLLQAGVHMLRAGVFCIVKESMGMDRGTDYYKTSPLRFVEGVFSCETNRSLSIFVHASGKVNG